MNLNILSYCIFVAITLYIIIWVGRVFHSNGRVFILRLFKGQTETADNTNNILLLAYYLFNIGYAIVSLSFWQTIHAMPQMIATISKHTGLLVLILALTHYFNMLLIHFLSKKINHSQLKS